MNPLRIPLYQIVDWADHFENAKSKSYQKCSYACVPNKQGGSGWSNVMGEVDGMAIYGVWMSIVQICSRQRESEKEPESGNEKAESRIDTLVKKSDKALGRDNNSRNRDG
jgi:hypothetical protein